MVDTDRGDIRATAVSSAAHRPKSTRSKPLFAHRLERLHDDRGRIAEQADVGLVQLEDQEDRARDGERSERQRRDDRGVDAGERPVAAEQRQRPRDDDDLERPEIGATGCSDIRRRRPCRESGPRCDGPTRAVAAFIRSSRWRMQGCRLRQRSRGNSRVRPGSTKNDFPKATRRPVGRARDQAMSPRWRRAAPSRPLECVQRPAIVCSRANASLNGRARGIKRAAPGRGIASRGAHGVALRADFLNKSQLSGGRRSRAATAGGSVVGAST